MNECAQQCWRDLSKPKHDMTLSYGGLQIPSSSRQYDFLIWPSVSMYKSTFFILNKDSYVICLKFFISCFICLLKL